MNEKNSQQLLYFAGIIILTAAWLFGYAVPRMGDTRTVEAQLAALQTSRSAIADGLRDYANTKIDKPAPTPNTAAWLTSHALQGLDKNLEANSPYGNGQGSQLKLRAVTAQQISRLMEHLRSVNIIVKSLKLDDPDGDGKWNLEMMAEVPS